MKSRVMKYTAFILVLGMFFCVQTVNAATFFDVTAKCRNGQQVELSISVNNYPEGLAGFDIYRADTGDGNYQYVASIDLSDAAYSYTADYWYYDWYDDGNGDQYSYTDASGLLLYHTYTYQIKAYKLQEDKVYLETGEISVTILDDGPVITYSKRNGKLGLKLEWTRVDGADGYLVYGVKNYDEKSNYINVDITDASAYELVETINTANSTVYSAKGLMNGVTYTYFVCSYKMMNGQMITSVPSDSSS
ncbi:MAG: hypothetical protein NC124_04220, partial [Clostridium sp.]|nr:hypothetical protein [Clostridium sp.]